MGMEGVVVVVVVVVGQYSYKKQNYAHYYFIIYAFNNQVNVSRRVIRELVPANERMCRGKLNNMAHKLNHPREKQWEQRGAG